MALIVLGLVKIIDNMISTAKSITTYKNKKFVTSLLVVLSQFLFYFLIKSVVSDDSMLTTITVCICSGSFNCSKNLGFFSTFRTI